MPFAVPSGMTSAPTRRTRTAQNRLGCTATVDVCGVEEGDADVERVVHTCTGALLADTHPVREPGAEGDLRPLELAASQLAVAHRELLSERCRAPARIWLYRA